MSYEYEKDLHWAVVAAIADGDEYDEFCKKAYEEYTQALGELTTRSNKQFNKMFPNG